MCLRTVLVLATTTALRVRLCFCLSAVSGTTNDNSNHLPMMQQFTPEKENAVPILVPFQTPRFLQIQPGDGVNMIIDAGTCLTTPDNVTCGVLGNLQYKKSKQQGDLTARFNASIDCDFGVNSSVTQPFPDIIRLAESCTCSVEVTTPYPPNDGNDHPPLQCDCTVCPQGFGQAPFALYCSDPNEYLIDTCSFLDCSLACNGTCSVAECLADTNPACPICNKAPGRAEALALLNLTEIQPPSMNDGSAGLALWGQPTITTNLLLLMGVTSLVSNNFLV